MIAFAPVPGFEDRYEVSNRGEVRSLTWWLNPRTLIPQINKSGYVRVDLTDALGIRRHISVHRLVLGAFVGPCPDGMEARHLDGNPGNNELSNLAYGTHAENVLDSVRHGTHNKTSKTHCPQGHEYTSENTLVRVTELRRERKCRTCDRDRHRSKRAKAA